MFFHHDPKTKLSTVWVEVRYSGLAEDFGWVLPLPKQPTVTVGTSWLFDRFDDRMAPKVLAKVQGAENCRDPNDGCVVQPVERYDVTSADLGSSWGEADSHTTAGGEPPPGVKVLDHG